MRALALCRRAKIAEPELLTDQFSCCSRAPSSAARASAIRSACQFVRAGQSLIKANTQKLTQRCAGSSTGPPAFFQAPKPPRICATGFSPMRCAVCAASAERNPPAQKNTYFLSCAKTSLW